MGFTVEQDCPQCGAPIELDETDRLLRCPYCDVKTFLFTPNYFRLVLPHKAPGKEIFYAPYLRFKGNVYYSKGMMVGHRVVDITHVGLPLKGIPASLGLRPQTMKMKFVTPDTEGSFLKFSLKANDILARAGNLSSGIGSKQIFHRAYIGETLSLIYLPLFLEGGRLFDAILNRPLARFSQDQDVFKQSVSRNPRWKLTFLPTLCPQCGWNLEGERDSVVLICSNCETAWEASNNKFVKVNFLKAPGKGENTVYLPFWKISAATAEGVKINSFADFIRLTNQPRVVEKEWEGQDMSFWSPAFKIRPKVYLNLSRQFTISQENFRAEESIPKKNLYPVTLPQTEAAQSMKITLASSALNKKMVLPNLPRIRFDIKDSTLVYLPFTDTGHEMVQQHLRISINKNTLEFGRQL
jgi:predicted RNA-binding Zn-ribbon protein involved in translation (DUF1610 family)